MLGSRGKATSIPLAIALVSAAALAGAAEAASNVRVNNPAADATSQDTQTGPVVARLDAGTLVAAFFDSGSHLAASKLDGIARSTDGGTTWTDLGALPTSTLGDGGFPRLARHAASGALVLTTAPEAVANAVPFFRSTDGGLTFSAPVNAAPGSGVVDFPVLLSDNDGASPFTGRLYVAYRDFGGGNGMKLTRSTDGGATWAPSGGAGFGTVGVGNGASLVPLTAGGVGIFYLAEGAPSTLNMAKSTDGGITFVVTTAASLVTTGTNGDLGLGFRTNAFPRTAVNPATHDIYLVYNDVSAAVGGDRGNVFLKRSTDQGATWSVPVKLNDDATTHAQFHPSVAVTTDGAHLLVAWYDRRSDPADSAVEYWGVLAALPGGAPAFGPNFRISNVAFAPVYGVDPSVLPALFTDYDAMTADASGFDVVWSDGRDAATFPGASRKNMNVRYSRVGTTLMRGDANGDFTVNVSDVFLLINALFAGGIAPVSACQGDANHDGVVNVGDVFYLINFLFAGGSSPAPPC